MRQIAPARAAALEAMPGRPLARTMIDALLRMLAFLGIGALLLVLSFVPVVGSVLGPVLQAWRSAFALAWELLDPYFDKLELDRTAQRTMLRAHQATLLGFALPFVFVLAIPIVGALAFGLAQAAVAMLVVEVIESPQGSAQA
jgi:CysZ protein